MIVFKFIIVILFVFQWFIFDYKIIAQNSEIKMITPKENEEVKKDITFKIETSNNIKIIKYFCDKKKIGTLKNFSQNFELKYSFNDFGKKEVKIIGYNKKGKELANKIFFINVVENTNKKLEHSNNETKINEYIKPFDNKISNFALLDFNKNVFYPTIPLFAVFIIFLFIKRKNIDFEHSKLKFYWIYLKSFFYSFVIFSLINTIIARLFFTINSITIIFSILIFWVSLLTISIQKRHHQFWYIFANNTDISNSYLSFIKNTISLLFLIIIHIGTLFIFLFFYFIDYYFFDINIFEYLSYYSETIMILILIQIFFQILSIAAFNSKIERRCPNCRNIKTKKTFIGKEELGVDIFMCSHCDYTWTERKKRIILEIISAILNSKGGSST